MINLLLLLTPLLHATETTIPTAETSLTHNLVNQIITQKIIPDLPEGVETTKIQQVYLLSQHGKPLYALKSGNSEIRQIEKYSGSFLSAGIQTASGFAVNLVKLAQTLHFQSTDQIFDIALLHAAPGARIDKSSAENRHYCFGEAVASMHNYFWQIVDGKLHTLVHGDLHEGNAFLEQEGRIITFIDLEKMRVTTEFHEDLHEIFKRKIYPSTNDFTTTGFDEWQSYIGGYLGQIHLDYQDAVRGELQQKGLLIDKGTYLQMERTKNNIATSLQRIGVQIQDLKYFQGPEKDDEELLVAIRSNYFKRNKERLPKELSEEKIQQLTHAFFENVERECYEKLNEILALLNMPNIPQDLKEFILDFHANHNNPEFYKNYWLKQLPFKDENAAILALNEMRESQLFREDDKTERNSNMI